ncbi:MAG TPA: universal stress protein [Solirubrobacteraceae bacterium]|nr:universal stress protein [Solirubrobacteraceae bacterium]
MTLVVGFAPDGRGRGVLHAAAMFARSSGDDIVVAAVIPSPWPPSPARVDAEWRAEVERVAHEALDRARERLPDDIPARFLVAHARSAPAGLLEVAEQHEASIIVTGAMGSTNGRLLYTSPIPVAVAPRGFRTRPGARVERVTAAFAGADDDLVVAAAGVAARVGASLRIASFAVRARPPYTSGVGRSADDAMVADWVGYVESAARSKLDAVGHLASAPRALEAVVGHGETWEEALEDIDWEDGDVLVVGSSSAGPLARVFLGSRATKIVRDSPVPTVVVPRGVASELAEEAESA